MYDSSPLWVELKFPGVCCGMYEISEGGEIRIKEPCTLLDPKEYHHSRNGFEYVKLVVDPKERRMHPVFYSGPKFIFRIDMLVAASFLDRPAELNNLPVEVNHKNGDTRDNNVDNLEWVECVEEWRPINYGDIVPDMYEVSNMGRIRDAKTKEIILLRPDVYGYMMVTLKLMHMTEGGYWSKPFKIHRLVCGAWYGESDADVNHLNGVHNDNYVRNLEYTTCSENLRHAVAIGKIQALPDEVIQEIFDALKEYGSPKFVHEQIIHPKYPQVSHDVVDAVKRGFYNHRLGLSDDFRLPKCRTTPTIEEMDMIRDMLIEYKGSPSAVFKNVDREKHPSISSRYVVTDIKRLRSPYDKSNKYSDEDLEKIRRLGQKT